MSKHHFTSRTKARKRAADVVFEADQRGMGRDPRVLSDLLRERKVITAALTPLPEYSVRIIEGVAHDLRRIDGLITAHAKVPGLDRIPAVDLAVLRVAVWEMLENSEDVPPLVAIDEAISIVKSISTDASPGFVNAVLDAVRRELQAPAWQRERVTVDEVPEDPREEPAPVATVGRTAGETGEESGADEGVAAATALVAAPSPADAAPGSPEGATGSGEVSPTPVDDTPDTAGATDHDDAAVPDGEPEPGEADVPATPAYEGTPAVVPDPTAAVDRPRSEDPAAVPGDLPDGDADRDAGEERATLRSLRDGHPTLDDLTQADLEELDELLDEY